MKLRSFNPDTVPVTQGKALISLNAKAGTVRFNKRISEQLGLKDKSQIELLQDEEDPATWFLAIVPTGGFPLRKKESSSGFDGYTFNSVAVVRQIFESVGFKGQSGSIGTAPEPETIEKRKMWRLITARLTA